MAHSRGAKTLRGRISWMLFLKRESSPEERVSAVMGEVQDFVEAELTAVKVARDKWAQAFPRTSRMGQIAYDNRVQVLEELLVKISQV